MENPIEDGAGQKAPQASLTAKTSKGLTLEAYLYGVSKAPKRRLRRRRPIVQCNVNRGSDSHDATATRKAPTVTENASDAGMSRLSCEANAAKHGQDHCGSHEAQKAFTCPQQGLLTSSAGADNGVPDCINVNNATLMDSKPIDDKMETHKSVTAVCGDDSRRTQIPAIVGTIEEMVSSRSEHLASEFRQMRVSTPKVTVENHDERADVNPQRTPHYSNRIMKRRHLFPVNLIQDTASEHLNHDLSRSSGEHLREPSAGEFMRYDYSPLMQACDDEAGIAATELDVVAQVNAGEYPALNTTSDEDSEILRPRSQRLVRSAPDGGRNSTTTQSKPKKKRKRRAQETYPITPAQAKKKRRLPVNELVLVPDVGSMACSDEVRLLVFVTVDH